MKQKKHAEKLEKSHLTPIHTPRRYSVAFYIKFWEGGAIAESKGGSFNVPLYLRYLDIISKK